MCPSLHQPSASFDVKSRESASHEICSPFYDTVETLRAHLDSDNSEASMSSGSGSLCATTMFTQPVWASGPLYGPAKIPAHILSQFQSRAAIKEGSTPSSSSSSCVNPSGEELPVLSSPPSPTVSEGGLDFSNFFEDDTEDSDDEGGYDSCSDADARSVKSDLSLRCRGLSPTGSQASQVDDDRPDPVLPEKEKDWVDVPTEVYSEGDYIVLDDGRISYSIRGQLGEGAYGTVYLARATPHDPNLSVPDYVAVKVFRKETLEANAWAHENIVRELFALSRAMENESSHLVCPISAFQDSKNVYVVMQLYGEDLANLVDWIGMRLSSWDIRIYTAELVLAIEQAHAIGFIHRDIKPQNIFIGPGGHIVLGDFSLVVWPQVASDATWEDGVVREDFPVATGGRYAPEQLRGEPCTYKVDLWALGLVLLEMYQGNGNPLFRDHAGERYVGEWEILNKDISKEVETAVPSTFACDLIKRLLNRDPGERPTIEEIKSHPFFTACLEFDWDACARGMIQPSYRPTRPREDYLPPVLDVGEPINPNDADAVKFPDVFFNFACMPHQLVPDEAFFPPWKLPTPWPRRL